MIAIKGAEIPRCCQNCFLIRYHDTLGYSCKATKNHIAKADVALKSADDCPLVEIVTCKDCENWDKEWTPNVFDNKEYHFCSMADCNTAEDYYCADAERRKQ